LQYGDIAILCRGTRSFAYYENAFDEMGIPYITVAGRGFYLRPEIRDLLNLLTAIADPHDDLALAGALRSPAFAVSDAGLYGLSLFREECAQQGPSLTLWEALALLPPEEDKPFPSLSQLLRARQILSELHSYSGRVPVAQLLKRLLDVTHYRAILVQAGLTRALRNVDKLLSDAHTSGLIRVGDFLEYLQQLRDISAREGEARAEDEQAVQIMTIHAAKGLEFPIVVLGDLNASSPSVSRVLFAHPWGMAINPQRNESLPLHYILAAEEEKDKEEEENKRLFYVAATRAQEKLVLNGNLTITSKGTLTARDGWMKLLASLEVLALTGLPYEEEIKRFSRTLDGVPFHITIYPPTYQPQKHIKPQKATELSCPSTPLPLLAPIYTPSTHEDEKEKQSQRQVFRIVGKRGYYPAWLLGQLVHEALASGILPGEGFARWAREMVQGYGLFEERGIERLVQKAEQLLRRFQRHPLYREMLQSQHLLWEVPFALQIEKRPSYGRIDALYRDSKGKWQVIEFKTDSIRRSTSLEEYLQLSALRGLDYKKQLQLYQRAVARWLGERPQAKLVFLDFHGQIHMLEE
ncbi:MAG: hypothetical protein J7M05_07105, partial [Anaerolineae bacterium]|nr:hypothetical protein [Anaerolineae bacterium]